MASHSERFSGPSRAFASTLGIPICAQVTPWAEGTGGFFLHDAAECNKLLLVTARHVVFPPNEDNNGFFEHKMTSQPRREVPVFSNTSFQRHLGAIQDKIKTQTDSIDRQMRRIQRVEGRDDELAQRDRAQAKFLWDQADYAEKTLNAFHQELLMRWATDEDRTLGHVLFALPIELSARPKEYTQDVAVLEIDASKNDLCSFRGNVIDLGTEYTSKELKTKFYPNPKNSNNFVYPDDRLLKLYGTIKDSEMREPKMYDQNGDHCIIVLKRGHATGLTIGRANTLMHYTRNYFGCKERSKEWGIVPFDNRSGAFSAPGDSGSVIVDGTGQIGGLLTGGSKSLTEFSDITYATPIDFVLDTIRSNKSLTKAFPTAGRSA